VDIYFCSVLSLRQKYPNSSSLGFVVVVVAVLWFEFMIYTLSHSTSLLFLCVMSFFKIGSNELFALAGFEP
jgi:hypothetical protein